MIENKFLKNLIRILAPILILAAGGLVFWLMGEQKPPPTEEPEESNVVDVETIEVALNQGKLDIEVDGLVVPHREVTLAAEVAGRITFKAQVCRTGNYVTQGTTLLKIDPSDYELTIRQLIKQIQEAESTLKEVDVESENTQKLITLAESKLDLQNRELVRFEKLAKRNFATDSQIDKEKQNTLTAENSLLLLRNQLRSNHTRHSRLESALELANVRLEKAQLDLQRTTIISPIDGVVVIESVEADSFASKGTPLVTIEDTSAVEVKCSLRMNELFWVLNQSTAPPTDPTSKTGGQDYKLPQTPVTVIYKLVGNHYLWNGVLSRYEGIGLDEKTRTMPCRVVVNSPRNVSTIKTNTQMTQAQGPRALVRGMFVTIVIHTKPKIPLISVPEQAIRPGNKIWRMRDGRLYELDVRVVNIEHHVAQVWTNTEDLIPGRDRIIVSPLASIQNGMAVKEVSPR